MSQSLLSAMPDGRCPMAFPFCVSVHSHPASASLLLSLRMVHELSSSAALKSKIAGRVFTGPYACSSVFTASLSPSAFTAFTV